MPLSKERRLELECEFWKQVNKNGPIHPVYGRCWLWTGRSWDKRYGHFDGWPGECRANRVSWCIHCGPIPEGQLICHQCDVPMCVNPCHLFLGSQLANIRDAAIKQKFGHRKGEGHASAKLTEKDVLDIRARYGQPTRYGGVGRRPSSNIVELAEEYGVLPGTIGAIVRRRNWTHI